MSLQVWLPLTGNFDNFGLSNCSVNAGSITYNSNGKIGSAATFSTDNNYIMLPGFASQMQTYEHYSLCAWIYVTSQSTDHSIAIISSGRWNYSGQHIVFGLTTYSNNAYHSILVPVATGGWSTTIALSTPINLNTWYHICITFDGNKTTAYLNGELQGTNTSGGISQDKQYCQDVFIGHAGTTYYSGFTLHGRINDVRIYDHCLSAKEVKEISKALVLYYPMNNPYISISNIAKNPKYENRTYGIPINANSWGDDAGTITYYKDGGYNNYPYKVIHKTAHGSGGSYLKDHNNIILEAGKTYTYSAWVKSNIAHGISPYSFNINGITATFNNQYIISSRGWNLTTEWQRLSYTFTVDSTLAGNYGEMSISYDPANYDIYICGFQIEEGTQATQYRTVADKTSLEIDCGIANIYDGTINGNITVVKDTPRNSNSYQFNGIDNYITADAGSGIVSILNSNIHTIACWVKTPSSLTSTNLPYFVCRTPSGYSTDCQVFLSIKSGEITHSYYSDDWSIPYSLANNTWYHIAFTSNNKQVICYVNGKNIASKTKGALNISSNGVPTVGADSDRTYRFKGNLSDFRIYATALSAEDIAELYHTSAIVDNQNNLYAYEYVEEEAHA